MKKSGSLTKAMLRARAEMAREIRAVDCGQLSYCVTSCAPGECWGCDVARILDAALDTGKKRRKWAKEH